MVKRFISNWFKLVEYILTSYLLATGLALIAMLLSGSETVHWLVKMILAPLLVFVFTLLYYNGEHAVKEARRMIIVWLPIFVLLDIFVYVIIAGFSMGWLFLTSQPWSIIYLMFVFISPLFVSYMRD